MYTYVSPGLVVLHGTPGSDDAGRDHPGMPGKEQFGACRAPSWSPKVCNIMAVLALFRAFGPLFSTFGVQVLKFARIAFVLKSEC